MLVGEVADRLRIWKHGFCGYIFIINIFIFFIFIKSTKLLLSI